MGQRVSRTDFEWTDQEQIHTSRSKEIIEKYPEIKKFYGLDKNLKWKAALLVLVQLLMLPIASTMNWGALFLVTYFFGGVINNALLIIIHDAGAHNLCFGHARPMANKILAIFANLPIGLPGSITFKYYHLEHHKYLGSDGIDPDIPSHLEAKLFDTTLGKLVWIILQPFMYAVRPMLVNPKPITNLDILNCVVQISFDLMVYQYFGVKAIFYLVGGSLIVSGLHPIAGRYIAEHYMVHKGFETYSYYGPLNYLTFNSGYHNEHHDFPAIPSCNLPKVREIAREYYDTIPYHTSLVKVIYDFVTDPNIALYTRMKRKSLVKETE